MNTSQSPDHLRKSAFICGLFLLLFRLAFVSIRGWSFADFVDH